MDDVKNEVAKNLLHYRKLAKITQKELAEQLGVKANSVSSWENGVNAIDVDTLYQACKIIGITFTEAFGKYAKGSMDSITAIDMERISKYHRLSESDKSIVDFILNKPEYNAAAGVNDKEIADSLSNLTVESIKKSTAFFNKA